MRDKGTKCGHLRLLALVVSAFALLSFVDSRSWGTTTGESMGRWSSQAVYLGYGNEVFDGPIELQTKQVISPDGSSLVVFEGFDLFVKRAGHKIPGEREWKYSVLSELLWAPDSQAFAITSSDGGWVGSWDVEVFRLSAGSVHRIRISSRARIDAMKRYKCGDTPGGLQNEVPNLAAIAWIDGSKRLLVAAEVPPHSSCRDLGKLFGYLVDIPSGHISARLDESQLRREWKTSLGPRLRGQPYE